MACERCPISSSKLKEIRGWKDVASLVINSSMISFPLYIEPFTFYVEEMGHHCALQNAAILPMGSLLGK